MPKKLDLSMIEYSKKLPLPKLNHPRPKGRGISTEGISRSYRSKLRGIRLVKIKVPLKQVHKTISWNR